MAKPTRTINRLHFSDLEPSRFEDLCLNLVSRLDKWKELNHFGRKGCDEGVDISAIKEINGAEKRWFIQCKRYKDITKSDLKEIIDKITNNSQLPNKLLAIVSCDISKANFEYFKQYSIEKGIQEAEIWSASIIESKLYKDFHDLLFVYFGLSIENKTTDNAKKIRYSLKMGKKVDKELIDHKRIKETNDFKQFLYDPPLKFISSRVIIRSVNDTTYPVVHEPESMEMSTWFRTFFYDTYHNGIELWLNAVLGITIIMDNAGYWEPIFDYYDKRKSDPKFKVIAAMQIGRIPYYNIVDFKIEGDEYFSEPHMFCKFNIQGMPYEEVYYKSLGDKSKQIPSLDFNKEKQTIFPLSSSSVAKPAPSYEDGLASAFVMH